MNLQELTKKLNNIDISDLQKINYKKLLNDLQKRPDVIIIIVAILITLYVSPKLYMNRRKELGTLIQETATLKKKDKAIDAYNAAQTELKEFIDNIPEDIGETAFMNQMTDFAESRHVQIKSFSPAKRRSEPLYALTSIVLDVSAQNYKDIWLFIHDIEKSPYSIRIDNWKGTRGGGSQANRGRRQATSTTSTEHQINVKLEIASIRFKK